MRTNARKIRKRKKNEHPRYLGGHGGGNAKKKGEVTAIPTAPVIPPTEICLLMQIKVDTG